MKRVSLVSLLALASSLMIPAAHAQSTNAIPGTQIRLTLLGGLSTRVAQDGDPITAVVAEPVFAGNQLIVPAGAKIHGTIRSVDRPKWFSMFRGGAAMNISFTSVEIESRIFPARMSILSIYDGTTDSGKRRKDLKTIEGAVIEQKQDIKGDVEDAAIGTAGGSTAGLIFSRVIRGTVIGLVGGGAYIAARKGKDVELPAETGMIVRLDSTLSVPPALLHSASYTSTGN
ncbi:MAG TPA: hypothetical protein VEJ67_15915 [Candidatus Cybelea sp.]|nr:hypothetical protein [Candidatus Cybelea sp.]